MSGTGEDECAAPVRVRLTDIASRAGVSLATVDRVMNRRTGVKERTRRRVLDVAREAGLLSADDLRAYRAERRLNIAFLLPSGSNPYLRLLGERVRRRVAGAALRDPVLRCYFIESFNAHALAEALHHSAGWADGIAFFAMEHPVVREAASEVMSTGTRLVTVVSGLGAMPPVAHIGLDDRAVGRTAGLLIGRLSAARTGSVALIAGSRHYRAHSEREAGFLSLQEELFPGFRIIAMAESRDEASQNHRQTLRLVDQTSDLVGIYNVGGASGGVARALNERHRHDVVFIGHALTADTRRAVLDGTMDAVFDQDAEITIDRAIEALCGTACDIHPMNVAIYFRENLP